MAPEVLNLVDHHFAVNDGLKGPFTDANEASGDISLERISRLLIERGDFPAVPIDFDYPCGAVTGWSQWVDYELRDEAVRERLSRAGVLSAVFISSRCDINRDVETLRHVVRRWNPHTHTFVCAWGEFTPTLEDVFNITRLPITGTVDPFRFTLEKSCDEELKILIAGASSVKGSNRRFANWVKHFWGVIKDGVLIPGEGFDSGCRLAAMLALWLTKYVFIEFSYEFVEQRVYPIAVAIATGHRFPLAPLFLGHVYRLLDFIVADELESAGRRGITTFVSTTFLQAFIWERFKCLEIKPLTSSSSLELYNSSILDKSVIYLPPKLPLLCRWFKRRQDKKVFAPIMLDNPENFARQPYIQRHGFEAFSFSGRKEQCATSLGRVELYLTNYTGFIPSFGEDKEALTFNPVVYSPDRVMRQLGCSQEVPVHPPLSIRAVGTARKLSPREVDCIHDFSGRLADIPSQLPGDILHPNASPDYSRYWKGVLHRFRQFVEVGSPQVKFKPLTSSRLANNVLTYARKHNLPYTEVYDNGTKKIVGHFKDFEPEGMDIKRKERDKTSSDKKIVREHHPKKFSSHFKPKVAFEEFMYKTPKGVKMIIPPKSPFWRREKAGKAAASTPQAGSASNYVEKKNASGLKARKDIKRKFELDPNTPLRRSNRIKFISSSSLRGPPVHIELFDTEHDHEKDSKQGRIDSSNGTSGVESMSNVNGDNGGKNLSNGDQVNIRSDELEHESDKQEQDQHLEVINTRIMETAVDRFNEEGIDTGMTETTSSGFNEQETTHTLTNVSLAELNVSEQASISPTTITSSSEHVSAHDQLTATKAQCHDSSRPARGHTSEWVARMDDFATRFNSNVESPLSMDDIVPQLSRDTAEFQGMRVSSDLVSPLTKFSEKYCEGNLLGLVNREYTLKKKNKLIEEFGMMLLSMEACQVKNEETFLVWRDACRDFMVVGFNVGFLLDFLRQAARQYFGYMMRPEGSDDCCARVHTLQGTILQKKKELVCLEEELGKAQSDLGFILPDVPASIAECALESSWKDDSRAAHYLY